ncbi:MAG: thiol:disulfide interchange protein DsbA/DsbL [Burkholderia sp.]|nr:thiol:disulfide interchange protein DsbA/DsbL [Burkholderia sp.]
MKKSINVLLLSLYLAVSGFAHATTTSSSLPTNIPIAGKDYIVIKNTRPTYLPTGNFKVIEFFWYGCPYCNKFEPILKTWVKDQGNKIDFKRIPVVFGKKFIPHARLFYTLEALGISENLSSVIFNEIHNKKNFLLKQQDQADFLAKQGIDKKKFLDIANSLIIENKIKKSIETLKEYEISTVPTVIIAEKYKTSPSYTKSMIKMVPVLNYLVKQVENEKNKSSNIR